MTFLTFHIWFLLQSRICLPQQLHTAWRHINITFLKKKIVLLEGPILRISFIKGSPDLLKIKKMKHKCTLNWINVKYTQVDLLSLKWRFLQRASDRPKSNAPCWQTLDRHLVIRHQKILLNVLWDWKSVICQQRFLGYCWSAHYSSAKKDCLTF